MRSDPPATIPHSAPLHARSQSHKRLKCTDVTASAARYRNLKSRDEWVVLALLVLEAIGALYALLFKDTCASHRFISLASGLTLGVRELVALFQQWAIQVIALSRLQRLRGRAERTKLPSMGE